MPGIEFEHGGFEVSDRVQKVLESIDMARLKNYILATCGNALVESNLLGSSCEIGKLVPKIQEIGAKFRGVEDDFLETNPANEWEYIHINFKRLREAFSEDMTDMLLKGCGCQNK
jgi:hypothetical protein